MTKVGQRRFLFGRHLTLFCDSYRRGKKFHGPGGAGPSLRRRLAWAAGISEEPRDRARGVKNGWKDRCTPCGTRHYLACAGGAGGELCCLRQERESRFPVRSATPPG